MFCLVKRPNFNKNSVSIHPKKPSIHPVLRYMKRKKNLKNALKFRSQIGLRVWRNTFKLIQMCWNTFDENNYGSTKTSFSNIAVGYLTNKNRIRPSGKFPNNKGYVFGLFWRKQKMKMIFLRFQENAVHLVKVCNQLVVVFHQ